MVWEKLFRRGLTIFLIAIFFLSAALVGAAVEIFDGAGQYIMSDFENHDIAKQRAQQRAERDAQKKAGVALKTFSRSINSELTDDEISAVTNNIIKVSDVNIVPVPFETNGEAGIMYRATLKATIDTDGIYAWIKRDDKEKVTILNQNNELQNAIAKNDKQVEDLKEKYNRATTQAEKDRIRKQMTDADRDFLANQKFEEGNNHYYAKDYEGAIKLYNEAIELKPNYAEAYNNRGNSYLELKQASRAIQDYNNAIQINPNFTVAYVSRGIYYYNLEHYYDGVRPDYYKSIQNYNKAIEIDPNYADAYYSRGIVYSYGLKQYNKAIQDFNKAIQLNSNYNYAYYNRGRVYRLLNKYELAIQDLNKAIQLDPNGIWEYQDRGFCYQALGDEEKAKADFANHYLTHGLAYFNLGQYEIAIKDYDKAIQYYNQATQYNQNLYMAYNNRGNAYFYLKQYERAIQDYNNAIQLFEHHSIYYNRGICYKELGDETRAQADFAKAKELQKKG